MTAPHHQAPDYAVLDEGLERCALAGPDLANGLSNHAPMAMEALCTLGRMDTVLPWLDRYAAKLAPRPSRVARIADADWRAGLGDRRRAGDWFEFFGDALEEQPWRDVLARWAPRLAPGYIASAMHGVLRTGHAVRALASAETPARRRELADGLAYWAAEYQPLPGTPRPPDDALPSDAIARVPLVPAEDRHASDTLTGALEALDAFPPFRQTLGAVDPTGDASKFLSNLTATFARVYLANAHDFLTTIAFVHGVTGPAVLRPMLPFLGTETTGAALAHAWQASAALYASFGRERRLPSVDTPPATDVHALVERAIGCADEHGIKFTAACLAEHALDPQPVFLAAADHAIGMLARFG